MDEKGIAIHVVDQKQTEHQIWRRAFEGGGAGNETKVMAVKVGRWLLWFFANMNPWHRPDDTCYRLP